MLWNMFFDILLGNNLSICARVNISVSSILTWAARIAGIVTYSNQYIERNFFYHHKSLYTMELFAEYPTDLHAIPAT